MPEVKLTKEDAVAALRAQFGSDDLVVDSWKQVSLMEDGRLGNLGDHFKLVGQVRHPATAAPRDFSFFVKAMPGNENARETVDKSGAFKKEMLFYKLLAKDFMDILREERGPDFQPSLFPRCHLIKEDCLLLDDLGVHNFKSCDGRAVMGIEHARMVVRDMAYFHAASMILEERHGRTLLEMYPELDFETFFTSDPKHTMAGWHRASFKLAVAAVPLLKYGSDPALVKRIQAELPDVMNTLWDSFRPWPGHRNVMTHADLWVNNFMYRHDAEGHPVELSFVDFQLMRYSVPGSDFMILLHFCTDKAFQDKYLDELITLYMDSLATILRRSGLDPEKMLALSEFTSTVHKMVKMGLILMVLEYPFALAPASVLQPVLCDPVAFQQYCHVDRTETCIRMFHDDHFFRYRFTETMERLIDGYLLNKSGDA